MAQKPSIPKGTRDFSPTEVAKRNYIFNIIKSNFQQFGFLPIETPSFENSETLLGKYGEEGDRLIFKILNSGDFLDKISKEDLSYLDYKKLSSKITEKALRYDLTVPFARYVVMNQNAITFPFKRYQIQPVWRADRPQKGRFREFYQCDADIVGSKSLWQEVELIQLYDSVFYQLGLRNITIKLNNRKILFGIAEVIGESNKLIDFTVALDKLDKIGVDGVKEEMLAKGISKESINKIEPLFTLNGADTEVLSTLKTLLKNSETGLKGVEELEFIIKAFKKLNLQSAKINIDVTLARGLNYYTGAILEVTAPKEVAMGSIGGGGRYDDLTGIFGLKDMSGVGISFGLDRIYLVLEELNLFPNQINKNIDAVFLNFGDEEALLAMQTISKLRNIGIYTELYPDNVKIAKQFQYIEKKKILYAIIIGKNEIQNNTFTIKNIETGNQQNVNLEELIKILS